MLRAKLPVSELTPLTDAELERFVKIVKSIDDRSTSDSQKSITLNNRIGLYSALSNEFTIAGKLEQAKAYSPNLKDDASFHELMLGIGYCARTGQSEKLDDLVTKMLPAIRRSGQTPSPNQTAAVSWLQMRQMSGDLSIALEKHSLSILDACLAIRAKQQESSRQSTSRQSRTLSNGQIQTYVIRPDGVYQSIRVNGPLSKRLLDESLLADLSVLLPKDSISANRILIPDPWIDHLSKPFPDARANETKSRMVLAAFSHWWKDNPAKCYEVLDATCQQFPDDVDLQIERANCWTPLIQWTVQC